MATASAPASEESVWHGLLRRPPAVGALIVLIGVVAAAAGADVLAPYAPSKLSIASRLQSPSAIHLFGTDEFGRDVLSRTIWAGRISLAVGGAVVLISAAIGVTLGLMAGYFRRLDGPLSRLIDAMMAFPDILLAIALVAALGPSAFNVILALGIVYAPRAARVVRASTLVIRELAYVEAAQALGVPTVVILVRHILRNLASPIMVQGTFIFANAILAEAGLSFLGVGVSPDIPTWGTMIAMGRQFMDQAGWIMWFPGIAIVLSVMSLQVLGDALRDLLDPRLARTT